MNRYVPVPIILLLLSVAVFALFVYAGGQDGNVQGNQGFVEAGGKRISVEIADTQDERARGLMFRESLCGGCGMLFVFDGEGFHGFWMKDTLIPLDMVFIDANMTVVDVLHAVPCEADPCRTYVPAEKALYVLEANAGEFGEYIIGQKVRLGLAGIQY